MRTREWTIRSRIFSLLVIPIASLIVLWVFATSLTVASARNLLATQLNYDEVGKPTESLISELQHERALSVTAVRSLAGDNGESTKQRRRTDDSVKHFTQHAKGDQFRDASPPETLRRVDDLVSALKQLPGIRSNVDKRQVNAASTLQLYSSIVERGYRIYFALPGIDEASISRDSRTIITLSRGREFFSQEDAVLAGVAAGGGFEPGEPGELAGIISTQRFLFSEGVVELPARDQQAYRRAFLGEAGRSIRLMEDTLVSDAKVGQPAPVDVAAWRAGYQQLSQQLRDAEFSAGVAVIDRGRPVGIATFVRLGLAGIIGLLAVIASIVVSVRVGRSLVRRLTDLERTAQQIAAERLPMVIRRLRRGEDVDVEAETPPLEARDDELGRVVSAFEAVRRTAVEAAVQEARLRNGLSKVFLNIARRSQTLLHRQLAQLDAMERKTIDPEQLQELFRVDHLATRMRRNAEDLVVLAGATPARGWRNPIPVVDVIRGAVSEVEEYTRVTIRGVPEVAIAGPAVGDGIHLLAELIENATSFSPPQAPVVITGQVVPKGLAIDIEDRGIGMAPHALEEANEQLANPPEFDPETSARLGLFVVATLSARHGVKVTLRRSGYGGVTAVVLFPAGLVVSDRTVTLSPIRPSDQYPLPSAGAPPRPVAPQPAAPLAATAVPEQSVNGRPHLQGTQPHQAESSSQQLTPDGLPKRRRQTHISVNLREEPAAGSPESPGQTGTQPRSPEQIRSTMSALQAGLHRGRKEANDRHVETDGHSDHGRLVSGMDERPGGDPDTTPGEDEGWRA